MTAMTMSDMEIDENVLEVSKDSCNVRIKLTANFWEQIAECNANHALQPFRVHKVEFEIPRNCSCGKKVLYLLKDNTLGSINYYAQSPIVCQHFYIDIYL